MAIELAADAFVVEWIEASSSANLLTKVTGTCKKENKCVKKEKTVNNIDNIN